MAHGDTPTKEPESVGTALHKRSCTRCNQRKVKCNRKSPCTACVKTGEACVFPGDKRAPRQLNRPPVGELVARLKELESEIGVLRSNQPSTISQEAQPPETVQVTETPLFNAFNLPGHSGKASDDDLWWNEFRRQYLQPAQIERLWILHQKNVAPLISIIHIQSTQDIIDDVVKGIELDPARQVLVLAICFSAVISMTPEQCEIELNQEHHTARKSYETAFEKALDAADVLKAKEITTIQAAVLFLLCSRAGGNTRAIWAKAAVIIRISQSMQLHRDGKQLGLSPFDTEIRRRLWWYICILDMLSSEDQAMDTQIRPGTFDTNYPSNVNGEDLVPNMAEYPQEKEIFTDITHCIMSSKVLNEICWSPLFLDKTTPVSRLADQEEVVTLVGKSLHDEYLNHFDLDIPLQWISATIIRLQLSRAWLFLQVSPERMPSSNAPHADTAFETAVESINFSYLLQTNAVTTQWSWLCKSYKQWQIMAYVLSELCARPVCAQTDHAWDVVTKMLAQWQHNAQKHTAFEKSFAELVERTAAVRAAKLASQPTTQEIIQVSQGDVSGISELGLSIDWLREVGL